MKTKKEKIYIYLEALQNGEFLDNYERALDGTGQIKLSASKGELTIPFYPMAQDLVLGEVKDQKLTVFIDTSMSAFYMSKGRFGKTEVPLHEDINFELKNGDYATIARNDLKILIKICPKIVEPQVPYDPRYRGKISDLLIADQLEGKVFLISVLLSLIVLGGVIGGLIDRSVTQPSKKEDLEENYNLAFVHPGHIKTLPEAVQGNLNRKNLILPAIQYYEDITKLFIGDKTEGSKYIFPSTGRVYANIFEKYNDDITKLEDQNRTSIKKIKENDAALQIPTIKGETFSGSVLRVTSKIAIMHQTFKENLKLKRQVRDKFRSDRLYDFEIYKDITKKGGLADKIGALRISKKPKNEEAMYIEAASLANKAENEQATMRRNSHPKPKLFQENSAPIGIEPDDLSISIAPLEITSTDYKIKRLRASRFDAKRKNRLREPVIGEINPNLITSLINKKKFELQLCFELALRRNRNLQGEIELRWILDTRGKVTDMQVIKSTISDAPMRNCVKQKISRWQFPRPREGSIEITYPFRFHPNNVIKRF